MTRVKLDNQLVLIVDDSPDTLSMLNDSLEATGMTTLVALEGKQAITIAKKITPDIILLDGIMPGMDGFETCRQIKLIPELKNIPIIFMTGLSDTDSIVKGFSAGGTDYLTKPINPNELIARITTHLQTAKNTISMQKALDYAGQNILAVDIHGKKIWSTPEANTHLSHITANQDISTLESELKHWLAHSPKEGNKMYFENIDVQYSAQFFCIANENEYLIHLIDEQAIDKSAVLKNNFNITQREADVFVWLSQGKTNREIAQILTMSPRTVNKHLEQLFKKLDVDNRTTAAALGIQCLQKHRV